MQEVLTSIHNMGHCGTQVILALRRWNREHQKFTVILSLLFRELEAKLGYTRPCLDQTTKPHKLDMKSFTREVTQRCSILGGNSLRHRRGRGTAVMETRMNGVWWFTTSPDSNNGKCYLGIFLPLTVCLQQTPPWISAGRSWLGRSRSHPELWTTNRYGDGKGQ